MPQNLSRERDLPEPLKIRTDWFNPSIAHQHNRSSKPIFENLPRLVLKKCPIGVVNSDHPRDSCDHRQAADLDRITG